MGHARTSVAVLLFQFRGAVNPIPKGRANFQAENSQCAALGCRIERSRHLILVAWLESPRRFFLRFVAHLHREWKRNMPGSLHCFAESDRALSNQLFGRDLV